MLDLQNIFFLVVIDILNDWQMIVATALRIFTWKNTGRCHVLKRSSLEMIEFISKRPPLIKMMICFLLLRWWWLLLFTHCRAASECLCAIKCIRKCIISYFYIRHSNCLNPKGICYTPIISAIQMKSAFTSVC